MPLSPVNPDYYSLVLSNCRLFHGNPDAKYEITSRLDASNQWHFVVLKTEKGERTKILSGTAAHPHRAMEILHENSGRLVDQHVSCHGYDLAPNTTTTTTTKTKSRAGIRGGEVPEVIALCGSSGAEDSGTESDSGSDFAPLPPRRRSHHRAEAVKTATTAPRRSRLDASDFGDAGFERRAAFPPSYATWGPGPLPLPLPLPQRPAVVQNPPPGWNNPPAPMPLPAPVPAPAAARPPPPPPAAVMPPPPPRSMPLPLPGQKTHAALLVLNLMGTGKKNMVAQVVPTASFLQQTATSEATLRPMSFLNSSANPSPYPPPMRGSTNYRATVRRVTLGDETYDVTSFGNDLAALFRGGSPMPKFEIDINSTGNFFPVMPPPPPPPRPASVASSVSSREDIAD